MQLALHLNGKQVQVEAEEDEPLLYVLRDRLGLPGAKFGCGMAQCGACTVLCDDRAVRSCVTVASSLKDVEVTTLEGLSAPDGTPSALQAAFLNQQAGQCGYCISGMIMAVEALLRKNSKPTREEIVSTLARNLCRCGTHNRIVAAVLEASGHRRA